MTFLPAFAIAPKSRGSAAAPRELAYSDLTIVVPVKNNQTGVTRLLDTCLRVFSPKRCPAEIIVVDNLSTPPLELPDRFSWSLPVRVLICPQPGAAAARNLGARQAQTPWILFLDSDCLPTPGLIDGYCRALNGAIAYAGMVRAEGNDVFSRYYDTQRILEPFPLRGSHEERPAYLITANALIFRDALAQIGGFDESFPSAGGEDIDLSLRLWEVGPLAYASAAYVLHTFEPRLHSFFSRFVRYGRGNRLLAIRYQADLAPRPFAPLCCSPVFHFLSTVQFWALWWGYHAVRTTDIGTVPLPPYPEVSLLLIPETE